MHIWSMVFIFFFITFEDTFIAWILFEKSPLISHNYSSRHGSSVFYSSSHPFILFLEIGTISTLFQRKQSRWHANEFIRLQWISNRKDNDIPYRCRDGWCPSIVGHWGQKGFYLYVVIKELPFHSRLSILNQVRNTLLLKKEEGKASKWDVRKMSGN